MAQAAFQITRQFISETCYDCGIEFAVLSEICERWRAKDEQWFYCPNGHRQHYSVSEIQKVRNELAAEKRLRQSAEETAEWERKRRVKEEKTHKKEMRKIHLRVGNGVCPCCNRSFINLQRHMNTKHPGFKEVPVNG
jgi:hypothetical protein